jgi:hypothetical protein
MDATELTGTVEDVKPMKKPIFNGLAGLLRTS